MFDNLNKNLVVYIDEDNDDIIDLLDNKNITYEYI